MKLMITHPVALMRLLTIRARMIITVALVLAAVLAIGGVGIAGQNYSRSVSASFARTEFAAMAEMAQLRTMMSELREHEKDMII